jgi:hypothetical protein
MPPPSTLGYKKQILSRKYIKAAVLRAFVEANIDEFGSAWTWEVFAQQEFSFAGYTEHVFLLSWCFRTSRITILSG